MQHIISLYDAEILYTDYYLGQLFADLDKRGLMSKTIIILVADHGEEFYEHGKRMHAHSLYNELLQVPFILYHPLLPPARITGQAALIDVLPTILDLLGISYTPSFMPFQGASLTSLLQRRSQERPIISELSLDVVALQEERYKLIYNIPEQRRMLFDREADPSEQEDLAGNLPEKAEELEGAIRRWLAHQAQLAAKVKTESYALDENTLARLKALGYI